MDSMKRSHFSAGREITATPSDIKREARHVSNVAWTCPFCGKGFTSKVTPQLHRQLETDCGKEYEKRLQS